jgi:hypothetical protein
MKVTHFEVIIYLLMWDLYHMTNIMPNSLYITFNTTMISITRYQDTLLISTNNECQNQQINVFILEYMTCFFYDIITLDCSFFLCIFTYLSPKKKKKKKSAFPKDSWQDYSNLFTSSLILTSPSLYLSL